MRVKNWKKFQHYNKRRPPWIKLYRDIIDDPDYHSLPSEAAKYLVLLWLIASEDKKRLGNLPNLKKLSFRLRITEKKLIDILSNLSNWLDDIDSEVIASRYHNATPETETERETETETEKTYSRATPVYKKIIDDLNLKCGTKFKHTSKKTKSLIKARLSEGFSVDDFFIVHTKKADDWKFDQKMRKFLRPETLYSNKFEGYLNQSDIPQLSQTSEHNLRVLKAIKEDIRNGKTGL